MRRKCKGCGGLIGSQCYTPTECLKNLKKESEREFMDQATLAQLQNDQTVKKFSHKIKDETGLSAASQAEALGVSTGTIYNWDAKNSWPAYATKALGYDQTAPNPLPEIEKILLDMYAGGFPFEHYPSLQRVLALIAGPSTLPASLNLGPLATAEIKAQSKVFKRLRDLF